MQLIFNRTSSTVVALACMTIAILFLVLSFSDPIDHYPYQLSFWVGFGIAVVAMAIIGVTSYYKERHGYSKRDVQNVQKTARALNFMNRTFWLWLLLVIAIGISFNKLYAPFAMGIGVGFFISISVLILIDNIYAVGMFAWNSHNAQIRRAYNSGKK